MYTPRGYSARLDVPVYPVPVHPSPRGEVRAASLTSDYNSDSAESLREIPPELTRTGSIYSNSSSRAESPYAHGDYMSVHSSRSSILVTKDTTPRLKRHSNMKEDGDNNFATDSYAKLNGSLDYSEGYSELPLTSVMNRHDNDVPPLDLAALRSSSDTVMSSNTYRPMSTLRGSDTYRTTYRSVDSEV